MKEELRKVIVEGNEKIKHIVKAVDDYIYTMRELMSGGSMDEICI
jgi:hypothetical protein